MVLLAPTALPCQAASERAAALPIWEHQLTEGGFGATGAMEGGLGAGGATPAIEGGLGAAGGADSPPTGGAFGAKEGSPGGLGTGGNAGGSPAEGDAETDSGAPGFGIGFGGRLIIAVSRGFDASG